MSCVIFARGLTLDTEQPWCIDPIPSQCTLQEPASLLMVQPLYRYFWSVLNCFKLKFGKSTIILTKCVTGNCSHVDKRLPSGPENERGPDGVPSRLCSKWEGVHCHETCR